MTILHLDSGREMRGGQWQVLALHRGLTRLGHESLLLAQPGAPLFTKATSESLPVQALNWRALSADIIHAHDAKSHTLAALFGRGRLVVSRRVAFPVRTSLASRWKYRKPRLFLAVSQFVAAQLRAAGVDASRIRVVYDGVQVPEQIAKGDGVITLHSADPAKGMALAVEAAKVAAIDLRISTDLLRDLPRARAMLYLTHSEGLGSGILLAMAHGVAVIASNTGGIPELIEDGVHGILVPNEVDAIVKALSRLNPSLGEALGEAARDRVCREFTEDRMIAQTFEAYVNLMENR